MRSASGTAATSTTLGLGLALSLGLGLRLHGFNPVPQQAYLIRNAQCAQTQAAYYFNATPLVLHYSSNFLYDWGNFLYDWSKFLHYRGNFLYDQNIFVFCGLSFRDTQEQF